MDHLFWGSPTANRGVSLEGFLNAINSVFPVPVRQILQLAIGSRGLSWQRSNMLNRSQINDDGSWTNHYPKGLRVYNVAGIVKNDGLLDKGILGDALFDLFIDSQTHENDVIVAAPEARLNFLYFLENKDNPDQRRHNLRGQTNIESRYHPFYASHVPVVSDVNGMTVFIMNNQELPEQPCF